jgi:subtilisin family serine protease
MARDRFGRVCGLATLVFLFGLTVVTAAPVQVRHSDEAVNEGPDLSAAVDRVIVRFVAATDLDSAAQVLDASRYRIMRPLMPHLGIFLVGLQGLSVEAAIGDLSSNAAVRYAHPDHQLAPRSTYPNDPYFYKQWNLHNVGENGLAFKETGSCTFNCSQVAQTSCKGVCGEYSPDGCWCDEYCEMDASECCTDYSALCGTSCEGICGEESADGCWCDSECLVNEDCCSDYQQVCSGASGPAQPTGACGCASTCIDPKNCCWDACEGCGTCSAIVGADVDAPEAWDKGTDAVGDTEVVIAVVDSGFDLYHTDLKDNIWQNQLENIGFAGFDDDGNGYIDDYNGWNGAYGDGLIVPSYSGHGSKVIGVVGAVGNNGKGVSGIAWNAQMMVLVYGDPSGFVSSVVASYEYVRVQKQKWLDSDGSLGANVVVTNNSFGVEGFCSDEYTALVDSYEALGNVGVLSAAAAANTTQDQDEVGDVPSGCASDYIIAVTNLDHNNDLMLAGYGKTTVDLAAPGENVYTTVPDDGYENFYGTSAATGPSECLSGDSGHPVFWLV